MTNVAWREDDFEERGIDPRMFASGGANNSVIEKESFWNPGVDLICVEPDGSIVIVEAKVDPRKDKHVVTQLHYAGRRWAGRDKLISIKSHEDPSLLHAAIVWSRSAIDEPYRRVEANSSVSSWEAKEEQNVAAIHPVTKSVYDQLTSIPVDYREPMRVLLTQFASFVTKDESTKLPPLRLAALEDSSYLLEWTFKDRRLGFSFEADPSDSGWYYVYSGESSERYESGTMDQLEMSRLIGMILKP